MESYSIGFVHHPILQIIINHKLLLRRWKYLYSLGPTECVLCVYLVWRQGPILSPKYSVLFFNITHSMRDRTKSIKKMIQKGHHVVQTSSKMWFRKTVITYYAIYSKMLVISVNTICHCSCMWLVVMYLSCYRLVMLFLHQWELPLGLRSGSVFLPQRREGRHSLKCKLLELHL